MANAASIAIKENIDYTKISAVSKPLDTIPGKVNVTEFFSFSCIHCSILEPSLSTWYTGNKKINLQRIQVVWESYNTGYAKINATAQLLKLNSKFIQNVFNATINDRANLEDPAQLKKFLKDNQALVDSKKFMATYNSFAISTKPQEYAQYTQAYNITGTPSFIVGNKYLTKPAQAEKLIQVLQALVDKVNQEQKNK